MKKILLLIGLSFLGFGLFGQSIIGDYGYFKEDVFVRDSSLIDMVEAHSEDSLEVDTAIKTQIAAYAATDTTSTANGGDTAKVLYAVSPINNAVYVIVDSSGIYMLDTLTDANNSEASFTPKELFIHSNTYYDDIERFTGVYDADIVMEDWDRRDTPEHYYSSYSSRGYYTFYYRIGSDSSYMSYVPGAIGHQYLHNGEAINSKYILFNYDSISFMWGESGSQYPSFVIKDDTVRTYGYLDVHGGSNLSGGTTFDTVPVYQYISALQDTINMQKDRIDSLVTVLNNAPAISSIAPLLVDSNSIDVNGYVTYVRFLAVIDSIKARLDELEGSDNIAPILQSAELGTYNDSVLVALFNEHLNEDSVPAITAFNLTAGTSTVGLDSAWIVSDTLFIGLDSTMSANFADSVLRLDYTKAFHHLQDSAGNDVASFSDSTVTNNLTGSFDGGMVNNGDFSDGETNWTDDANFVISGGVATFNDVTSGEILQTSANMATYLSPSTAYTMTLTVDFLTATSINISIRDAQDNDMTGTINYTTEGNKSINFTTVSYGDAQKGFKITASSSGDGTFTVDNIAINPQ